MKYVGLLQNFSLLLKFERKDFQVILSSLYLFFSQGSKLHELFSTISSRSLLGAYYISL